MRGQCCTWAFLCTMKKLLACYLFCSKLLRLLKEFSRSFDGLYRLLGQSVRQPIPWVSQPAGWLLLQPGGQSFSQAVSQPISHQANKADCRPASPSVNPLISSRPSVSQQPPSRWASWPFSQPVSWSRRYVNHILEKIKQKHTSPVRSTKTPKYVEKSSSAFYGQQNIGHKLSAM